MFKSIKAGLVIPLILTCVTARATDFRRIDLTTQHSKLSLMVDHEGRLYQLGYGSIDKMIDLPTKAMNRLDEFYPPGGDGFINEPAIQVAHADGNTSTDLAYVGDETKPIGANVSLTAEELRRAVRRGIPTGRSRAG